MLRKRLPSGRRLHAQDGAGSALTLAQAWLARRDFCSADLAARLATRGFDAAEVQATLQQLIANRIVDDARYAERFVVLHAGRGQGPVRIRHDLLGLGVTEPIVEAALEQHAATQGDWISTARAVRARRFGASAPTARAERARQARFLQFRGFSTDDIRAAVGSDALSDAD